MFFENKETQAALNLLARMRRMRHLFVPIEGLTPAQFHLLRAIQHIERHAALAGTSHGAPLPGVKSSELARQMKQAPPSVTQRVNELEQMHYVKRIPDKKDRRVNYICLTEQGKRAMEESAKRLYRLFNRVNTLMGEENMNQFIKLADLFCTYTEQAFQEEKNAPKQEENAL